MVDETNIGNLTRRDFLKKAAVVAASVGLAGVMTKSQPSKSPETYQHEPKKPLTDPHLMEHLIALAEASKRNDSKTSSELLRTITATHLNLDKFPSLDSAIAEQEHHVLWERVPLEIDANGYEKTFKGEDVSKIKGWLEKFWISLAPTKPSGYTLGDFPTDLRAWVKTNNVMGVAIEEGFDLRVDENGNLVRESFNQRRNTKTDNPTVFASQADAVKTVSAFLKDVPPEEVWKTHTDTYNPNKRYFDAQTQEEHVPVKNGKGEDMLLARSSVFRANEEGDISAIRHYYFIRK